METFEQLNRHALLELIEKLPYPDFKHAVQLFAQMEKLDFHQELNLITTFHFQSRMEKLGINNTCPSCGSSHHTIHAIRNEIKRYRCKDCSKTYTLFSGTVIEKTKWHWDIWVRFLELTIHGHSLNDIQSILESEFGCNNINHKTVFLWRHKLIYVLAQMSKIRLSNYVYMDGITIRESQKGSRSLINYKNLKLERKPRTGRLSIKKEATDVAFTTIATAVDSTGHCICNVIGMGKNKPEDIFNALKHYLEDDGHTPLEFSSKKIEEPQNTKTVPCEKAILTLDYFKELNVSGMSSSDMSLKLHADIQKFICQDMANVSTKYLEDYLGFFTYMRNWRIDHGRCPFSRKDIESIFIEIIKSRINYSKKRSFASL
ncbi:conserved protein of unknown function [Petrocella atlantisensis]|uniref:Uncharacterized protein n=1 Tax=Petrocella atlantisensis TaxID=2173034 RepID=A0A3P7NUX2_9FIRM|nr:IS1 family transposase [Petrocella atlantisensis]VDN46944.1 conserved protein of unknown function [Petrocella atlantisensis]